MFDADLKDSGSRQSFQTGAVRDDGQGKGMPELFPADALIELSKHFEKGARKYDPRNWEQGIPYSKFIGPMIRHTLKHLAGEVDEPHLVAAVWNGLCLIQTMIWVDKGVLPRTLDDLPGSRLAQYAARGVATGVNTVQYVTDVDQIDTERVNDSHAHDTQALFDSFEPIKDAIDAALEADDRAAELAYEEAAGSLYGPFLYADFSDEDSLYDYAVVPTGFVIDNDQQQYFWDGVGSVTWNDATTKQIKHAAFTSREAYDKFAYGEWNAAPHHSFIALRRYVPTNPASSNVEAEFGVEANEQVSFITNYEGNKARVFVNHNDISEYFASEDWTEGEPRPASCTASCGCHR